MVLVNQHAMWSFCADYRKLNLETTGPTYTRTRMDSIFDGLHRKEVCAILDAARGYDQIPFAASDCWKTVFTTHQGLLQDK